MKRVFWDLEVSPNIVFTWRLGSKVFLGHDSVIKERAIICACWKEEGVGKVNSLEWDKGDDKDLCIKLREAIIDADELVAHNGDNFDFKWFNTRLIFHGIEPLPEIKTVDTLKLARRKFYFNSNKLDYISNYLGYPKKDKTDFSMWQNILMDNSESDMKRMVTYCKKDVVLGEKVYHRLAIHNKPSTHMGVLDGGERHDCPRCGSEYAKLSKRNVTAAGMPRFQMRCDSCRGYFTLTKTSYDKFKEAHIV